MAKKAKIVKLTSRQKARRQLDLAAKRRRRGFTAFTRKAKEAELHDQASGASRMTRSAASAQRRKKKR